MTVNELMTRLEEMPENAEVRLAHQPSWPFEYSIDSFNPVVETETNGETVVYIVEGSQLDYLGQEASEAIGW